MKKPLVILACALLVLGLAQMASATPVTIKLVSGADTVSIADGSAGDINPLAGVVSYASSDFNGWTISFVAGTSHSPNLFPFALDLTNLSASCALATCPELRMYT